MPFFCVREDVVIVRHGGQLVFLNIEQDDYMGVDVVSVNDVAHYIHGWPWKAARSANVSAPSRNQLAFLRELVEEGCIAEVPDLKMVRFNPRGSRAIPPVTAVLEPVTHSWSYLSRHPGRVWAFVAAYWSTSAWRKDRNPTRRAVFEMRRFREQQGATDRSDVPIERVRDLVATAYTLQPMFLNRRKHCLEWSLLLMEYLRRMEVRTDWVFGVRSDPFAAHAWIQFGSLALDGNVEEFQNYSSATLI